MDLNTWLGLCLALVGVGSVLCVWSAAMGSLGVNKSLGIQLRPMRFSADAWRAGHRAALPWAAAAAVGCGALGAVGFVAGLAGQQLLSVVAVALGAVALTLLAGLEAASADRAAVLANREYKERLLTEEPPPPARPAPEPAPTMVFDPRPTPPRHPPAQPIRDSPWAFRPGEEPAPPRPDFQRAPAPPRHVAATATPVPPPAPVRPMRTGAPVMRGSAGGVSSAPGPRRSAGSGATPAGWGSAAPPLPGTPLASPARPTSANRPMSAGLPGSAASARRSDETGRHGIVEGPLGWRSANPPESGPRRRVD